MNTSWWKRVRPSVFGIASGAVAVIVFSWFAKSLGISATYSEHIRFGTMLTVMVVVYLAFAVIQKSVVSGVMSLPFIRSENLSETTLGMSTSVFLLGFSAVSAAASIAYRSHPDVVVPIVSLLSLGATIVATRRLRTTPEPSPSAA